MLIFVSFINYASNGVISDTPNTITEEEFAELGEVSEGCSGSDISVITREALMEPLRKCQAAKQFIPDRNGMLSPLTKYINS